MAARIEFTRIRPVTVTAAGSRYQNQNVIYYGDQKLLTFDTYLRQGQPLSGQEQVMVITKGVEYRPDLVSYDVYGFTDAWWVIMEANKIYDIFDFKAGRTIAIPARII